LIELISLKYASQPLVETFNAQHSLVRVLAFVSPT
jgi:hypothetical protein